jgi:hypothetical protein
MLLPWADQQVNVLGHEDVSPQVEIELLSGLLHSIDNPTP